MGVVSCDMWGQGKDLQCPGVVTVGEQNTLGCQGESRKF